MISKRIKSFLYKIFPVEKWKDLLYSGNRYKGHRYIGEYVQIGSGVTIKRRVALNVGNNVIIEKDCTIDATYGIMIGDDSIIKSGTSISTVSQQKKGPIIIGAGNIVDNDLGPNITLPNKKEIINLEKSSKEILFVVSTGRSGSNAIVDILNQYSGVDCFHEAFSQIYPLALGKLYGKYDDVYIKSKLIELFNATSFKNNKLHLQSDQKIAPLIPILAEIFPKAKFLWILRDAKGFINSAYPRGWFANSEFGYENQPEKEFFPKQTTPIEFHAEFRVNGYLAGCISEVEWKKMTAFERNCWYWNYWNKLIEEHFIGISSNRKMMIKLSELNTRTTEILEFVKLPHANLPVMRSNSASYKKMNKQDWNSEMDSLYRKNCGDNSLKWFGRL